MEYHDARHSSRQAHPSSLACLRVYGCRSTHGCRCSFSETRLATHSASAATHQNSPVTSGRRHESSVRCLCGTTHCSPNANSSTRRTELCSRERFEDATTSSRCKCRLSLAVPTLGSRANSSNQTLESRYSKLRRAPNSHRHSSAFERQPVVCVYFRTNASLSLMMVV
jgi:hypothetical protein